MCVVNGVDDVAFPSFNCITNMPYLDSHYHHILGCDCSNGCNDSRNCRCVAKNGGEVPFSDGSAVIPRGLYTNVALLVNARLRAKIELAKPKLEDGV